jgi:hypothetical protein
MTLILVLYQAKSIKSMSSAFHSDKIKKSFQRLERFKSDYTIIFKLLIFYKETRSKRRGTERNL